VSKCLQCFLVNFIVWNHNSRKKDTEWPKSWLSHLIFYLPSHLRYLTFITVTTGTGNKRNFFEKHPMPLFSTSANYFHVKVSFLK